MIKTSVRRRLDARTPWRRPWLPLALWLGYAWIERDTYGGRVRLVVEPTEAEIDSLPSEIEEEWWLAEGSYEIPA